MFATRKERKEANERLEASGIKTRILFFADSPKSGCGATVLLASGEPCLLSIAQSGILVRKTRYGFFGAELFNEKSVYQNARRTGALAYLFPIKRFPDSVSNPVLRAFFNAILHCRNANEVCEVLNRAIELAEAKAGCGLDDLQASDFPAWSRPVGPPPEMDAERQQREKDFQVIEAFSAMLAREPPDPTLIYDAKRLPFAKIEIQKALLRLSNAKTEPTLPHAQMALMALARYQVGVGEPPIDTVGFREPIPERIKRLALAREKLSPEDATQIRAYAQKVLAAGDDPRIREFQRLVDSENEQLVRLFKRAENGRP